MQELSILDTGASCSIINNINIFVLNRKVNKYITIFGTNKMKFKIQGIGTHIQFPKIQAYYIPDFPTSIIAEVDLANNYQVRFIYGDKRSDDQIYIHDTNNSKLVGNFTRKLNNLYILEHQPTVFMSIREEMYEKRLNKKQVDRMFRVHELHKRCGYTS